MPGPGLVEQLQAGTTDGHTPINDLLRKVKLAATKLKVPEFAAWADLELSGYPDMSVPQYRLVSGEIKGLNAVRGWITVLGVPKIQLPLTQSVTHIASVAQSSKGPAMITLPEDMHELVTRLTEFETDFRFSVPIASLLAVIDCVRSKILEWTLELEASGVYGEGLSFSSKEVEAAKHVTTNNVFNGPVGAVAQGQSFASHTFQTNDQPPAQFAESLASLVAAIQAAGTSDAGVVGAVSVLAEGRVAIEQGKATPVARLKAALDMIRASEDVALRAPEVLSRIHDTLVWLGFS